MTIKPAITLPEEEPPVLDVEHVSTLVKASLSEWHWRANAELKDKLTHAWITSHRLGEQLAQRMKLIKSPANFARPLLRAAMKGGMDGDFDVDKDTFVHSTNILSGPGSDAVKEPLEIILPPVLIPKVGGTRWSLLEASLQNFSAAEIDAFKDENVFILRGDNPVVRSYLNPRRFANLCRRLNIGARYQAYLNSQFWPYDHIDQSAPDLSIYGLYPLIMAEEKSRMEVLSHEAYLRGDISGSVHRLLLQWVHDVPDPKWWIWDVRVHRVSLLQVPLAQDAYGACPLHGVLVITPYTGHANTPCVVYAPHDTQRPLFEYPSLQAFNDIYALKLRAPTLREQLQKTVELHHQPYFLKQLSTQLILKGRTPAGMPIEVFRQNPDLNVTLTQVNETPFVELYRQTASLSLSNALTLAVPTHEETFKTLLERFHALLEAGVPLLNLVAFFVPPLGAALLVSSGIEILSEIYTGFEDWSHGDVEEAFEHFGGVAKNLVVLGVGAQASSQWSAVRSEIAAPPFMDDLHWVKTRDGQRRYWKFDLAPYASKVKLDPQLLPDAQGIYSHNGQSFVHIKGQPYAVKLDGQQWRVVHATREAAYAPVIEHNGHGAWRLSVERAIDWDAEEVFKRAWPGPNALSHERVQQIMNIVGHHEDAVRWSHVNGNPPPALVIDTFKRFKIVDEVEQLLTRLQPPEPLPPGAPEQALDLQAQKTKLFNERYQATEDFSSAPMALIHQHYKSLPASVVKEVLQHAHPGEVDRLLKSQRVPLRMAEEIRHYSQQVRMARAIEGCYLGIDPGGSTYHLGHGLFSRLELGLKYLREAPEQLLPAPAAGEYLFISQVEYLQTLMQTDPALRDELVNYALKHPEQARKAIGLQPIKPWFKSPMRLTDGRLGYPLSGRGAAPRESFLARRVGQLYPTYTSRQRLAFLNALGQRRIWPEGELIRRELELEGLSEMLREWTLKPLPDYSVAARRDVEPQTIKRSVAHTIKRAWRRETRVEGRAFGLGASFDRAVLTGHDLPDARGYKLDLSGLPVGDLPGLSGSFGHVSVLIMDDMALTEPPEEFLSSFPNVRWLSMQNNALKRLPDALQKMKHLEKLDLGHNQIELNLTSVPTLADLTGLKELNLSHNPLGRVPDVSRMEYLQQLDVRHTGSITWPVGAHGLTHLTYLDLRDNLIKEIPDATFSAPQNLNEVTYLHDNPLSPLSESRLNDYAERTGISMGYSSARRYSHLDDPSNYAWFLTGAEPAISRRVDVWQALEQDPATRDLRRVLSSLRGTPAYANENTRTELIARVGRVLDALGEDTALRESLLVSSEHGSTCGDGVALIFSNLEILILAARIKATDANAPRALLRLARNVFRLDQVELLARQFINDRLARIAEQDSQESDELDDIELRLAFRVALAGPLELPAQPQSMTYEELANVPAQVIENTRLRVLANEQRGSSLLDSICERDFWVKFLIEKYADQFQAIYDEYAERSNTVELESGDLTDHGYKQSLEGISADYKAQQTRLITQLTRQEMRANPF